MQTGEAHAVTDFLAGRLHPDGNGREIVDSLPVAVYATDADGRLTYFNHAAVKLSGRVPVLGTDQWCVTWKLFLPDGTPLAHDQCPMALALKGAEVPVGTEYIAERPDGSRFWFTPYPAVLRGEGGHIVGGINVLVDVTARKGGEMEAVEHFRAMVETTPEFVTIVARDGTLLFMNSSGVGTVGAASAHAVVGTSIFNLIAPRDRDRFREFHERICQGEKDKLEFDIMGLDGVEHPVESHASPLQQADGSTVHLGITRDIAERKQTERAILLLGAIVDSSDDAIISKDLDGTITSWNNAAERLFGYTAAETISRPVTMLIPPDRLEEEPRILARLRKGERVDHFETLRRRKDGTLVDISLTISPVKDRNGCIVGASKIARDITQRKQAETAQKRVEEDLRRANQDLEQFAFSASHDLQEPLRSIKIYSELLESSGVDGLQGESREFLTYLRSGATRMEMLVRDLLSYTQVTKFDKPVEAADAGEALKSALASLEPVIAETGARISVDPLPAVCVHRVHLEQLFQNLVGNAIKYRSPERPPAVHVTAELENGHWIFSVADNGIGVEPEYRENIFGLFKRLHTSDEYSGTGIGLAICRRIVDRYNGRIWVESNSEKGSTFRFTIPV